jgi:hypothetical protein
MMLAGAAAALGKLGFRIGKRERPDQREVEQHQQKDR